MGAICIAEALKPSRCEISTRAPQRAFFGALASVFAISATVTIVRCASMSAMREMPMPGGWSMSMVWTRMPSRTWAGSAVSFLDMWVVMMIAMMLPSLAPVLWRHHQSVGRSTRVSPALQTALVGVGYFFVWAAFGIVVFPLGVALASVEMHVPALARTVPIAGGGIVLIAGAFQFTAWKVRRLVCCREMLGCGGALSFDAVAAWRLGVRIGLDCCYCCAALTVILLVLGVMDLRVMCVVAAAITIERLAPDGKRAARAVGIIAVGAALFLITRAAGL